MSVDHHEADRLLRQVVRRLYPWRRHEREVGRSMVAETLFHVLAVPRCRACQSDAQHLIPSRFQELLELLLAQMLALVEHLEEFLQGRPQVLAIAAVACVGQRGQELHVPDQMGQAELQFD